MTLSIHSILLPSLQQKYALKFTVLSTVQFSNYAKQKIARNNAIILLLIIHIILLNRYIYFKILTETCNSCNDTQ